MSILKECDEIILSLMEKHDYLEVRTDPIYVHAASDSIVFGLPEKYSTNFPSSIKNVALQQHFLRTIIRINEAIKRSKATNKVLYRMGFSSVVCTLGTSLLPSYLLVKKAIKQIKEILREENEEIYCHYHLNWSLERIRSLNQEKVYTICIKRRHI